jgi:hypothetical protein
MRSLLMLINADKEPSAEEKRLIPAPSADEVKCTQPYLLALFRALGSILNDTRLLTGESPVKADVMNNRVIQSTDYIPKRTVDKTISANTDFIYMFRDDAIELAVKMKSLVRGSDGPEKLIRRARDQIISHYAKHLSVACNFAGKGIDTRATGVVLTPACVKILQLRLVKMGTPEVKLVLLETYYLPLLSPANFDDWTKSSDGNKDMKAFRDLLYPNPASSTDTDVPAGLVALAKLMTTTRKDLVGPCPFESEEVGDMIGFGSFATVWIHKGADNQVIKLSRYGAKIALEQEAKVLKELGCDSGCIPRWVGSEDLKVVIGGVSVVLPALVMEPRGISIEMMLALLTDKDARHKRCVGIGEELVRALSFIHGKGTTTTIFLRIISWSTSPQTKLS